MINEIFEVMKHFDGSYINQCGGAKYKKTGRSFLQIVEVLKQMEK